MMKSVVKMVANASVGALVGNIINITMPQEVKVTAKVMHTVGGMVVAMMLSEKVDTLVEDEATLFKDIFKKTEKEELNVDVES